MGVRRSTRLRLAEVATAVVAAVLIGPLSTPARAAFAAPVPLSNPDVVGAKVASDPSGDVFSVWSQREGAGWRVQGRWVSDNGALGPVTTLSAAAPKPLWPQVAIDSFDYGATVVWSVPHGEDSPIKARHISPQGRLSAVKNLSGGRRTAGLRIASASGASPIVVWSQAQRRSWRIKARTVSYTGTRKAHPLKLGPVKTLSSAGKKSKDPEAATDGDGHAVVVWSQRGGASAPIKTLSGPVKARRIEPNGHLGSIKTLSKRGRGSGEAQVAVDLHGHAVAVWSQANSRGRKPRIKARRIGAFAGAQRGVMNLSTKNSGDPSVGIGLRGNATVVWDTTRGTKGRVQARHISPKGALGPVQTLSAPGGSANSPRLGTNYGGNTTVVWYVFHPSGDWPVQARRISASGKLRPLQTIASTAGVRQPQIAVNTGGKNGAFAVWSQLDGSTWRAWGSRGA